MNIDVNVQKILFALIKKWKLLLIFAIIGGLLGYIYTSNFTTLTYTSSVTFLASAVDSNQEINDDNDNNNSSSSSSQNNASSEYVRTSNTSKMNYAMRMLPTYIKIMQTNEFNEKVAKSLNERINSNYSSGVIKNSLLIESVKETAIFVVNVTTTDPNLSYEIAHQLETSVPEMMEETNSGLVRADVKDKAVKSESAESLDYGKKCAIGVIAGVVIAAAYVILRSLLDVRIKSEEELIEKYNIPVLGSIPNFESRTAGSNNSKKKGAAK